MDDTVVVTVMADLEKGFGRVRHDQLRRKAAVYGFPEEDLELALSMYTAPRRIRYGNAFSKSAYTEIGVLAGCPVAMGLLLLSVLEPMDKFWKTIPRELISAMVYVDDFALSFAFQKASTTLIKCRVTRVFLELKQQLQNHGLFLADDTSKLTASKAEVGQAIKEHMERSHHLKIAYQANMTMLGVDYAAGKPVTYGRANQRFREAMIKGNKITVIAKGGWRLLNVMKAHVVSTVTYSARSMESETRPWRLPEQW